MANPKAFSSFSFPVKAAPNLALSAYKVYASQDEFTVVEASSAANAVQDSGIMAPVRVEHMSEESRKILSADALQATEEKREIGGKGASPAPIRFARADVPDRSTIAFEPFVFPQKESEAQSGIDVLSELPDAEAISAEALVEEEEPNISEPKQAEPETLEAEAPVSPQGEELKNEPLEDSSEENPSAVNEEDEAADPALEQGISDAPLSEEEVTALMAEEMDSL